MHPAKRFGTGSHRLDRGYGFLSGEWKTLPPVPMFNIADVRDLARVHNLALGNGKAGGETIICASSGSMFSYQLIVDVIRKLWPEWDGPIGTPGKLIPEGLQHFEVGNQRSMGIFGKVEVQECRGVTHRLRGKREVTDGEDGHTTVTGARIFLTWA